MVINIRKREQLSQTDNSIVMSHHLPIFRDILNAKSLYNFPNGVLENRAPTPRYRIRGCTGTVKYIFKHTKNITCFIILITSGKSEGKYIVSSRKGFKKNGRITVESSNFDTPLNKELRRSNV